MTTSGVNFRTTGRADPSSTDRVPEEEDLLTFNLIFKPECVRTGDTLLSIRAFFDGDGLDIASGSGDSISSCVMEVLANVLAIVGVVWIQLPDEILG